MRTVAHIGLLAAVVGLALAAANWGVGWVPAEYEMWFYLGVFALCQIGGGMLLCAALVESERRRHHGAGQLVGMRRVRGAEAIIPPKSWGPPSGTSHRR